MAQSLLMKQGLEGLFSPEQKFESEARFGRQIYITAWCVEILAASIGLIIAWVTAYDAWNSEQVKTTSHLLNSILGALPFLVIAVIEPTKIPLAGGLYKTRIFGWKILILITLLGLTAVTFETMFNGLERNLTSVTKKVVDAENNIVYLQDQVVEKQRKFDEIDQLSEQSVTADLQAELSILRESYEKEIGILREEKRNAVAEKKQDRQMLLDKFNALAASTGGENKQKISVIETTIDGYRSEIESNRENQNTESEAVRKQFNDAANRANADNEQRRTLIQSQIEVNRETRKATVQRIEDSRIQTNEELQIVRQQLETDLNRVKQDRAAELDENRNFTGNVPSSKKQKINAKYDELAENYRTATNDAISRLNLQHEETQKSLEEEITALDGDLKRLNDDLKSINSGAQGAISNLNDQLDEIRDKYDQKIDA